MSNERYPSADETVTVMHGPEAAAAGGTEHHADLDLNELGLGAFTEHDIFTYTDKNGVVHEGNYQDVLEKCPPAVDQLRLFIDNGHPEMAEMMMRTRLAPDQDEARERVAVARREAAQAAEAEAARAAAEAQATATQAEDTKKKFLNPAYILQ